VADSVEYPNRNRLQEMAAGERPQERLERHGAGALSDTELLAVLLRSGTRGQDVMTLTTRLLAEAGSLAGLLPWREAEFRQLKGIGRVKSAQLVTVMEIVRRVVRQQAVDAPLLNRAEVILAHFQPLVFGLQVEKFWVLCLNRKNRLLRRVEITSGTATSTLAHPREVYREAIREGAASVICVHNHPSGDPAPSAADLSVTRQLREAARAVDIELVDHIIIGRPGADPLGRGYYSFREAGLI
jgi:DNA repair protein RadC